jgi:glycosyltransferase involved in cell wall biosynthesis
MKIIAQLPSRPTGVEYHRLLTPLTHLVSNNSDIELDHVASLIPGARVSEKEYEVLNEYDIVYISRAISNNLDIDNFVINSIKKHTKCKIVLDIDDYWVLPKNHLLYEHNSKIKERVENLLKGADIVLTTTQPLLERCSLFNNNSHLVPNAIDSNLKNWYYGGIDSASRNKVGWVGSASHNGDIEVFAEAVPALYRDSKIELVLGGYDGSKPFKRFERMFIEGLIDEIHPTEAYNLGISEKYLDTSCQRYTRLWAKSPGEYSEMYDKIDISIAPLAHNEFNECKSNLKVLEAGFKRKPIVASNVTSYREFDIPLCNNWSEFYTNIKELVNSESEYVKQRESLYTQVQQYEMNKINPIRYNLLKNLISLPND